MDDAKQPASESSKLIKILTSTVMLKAVMALTGAGMVGFVAVHMAGHLQMFLGRDAYNHYAHFMQSLGELLWIARLGLLGVVGAHIAAAVALSQRNMSARERDYLGKDNRKANVSSLSMRQTGLVILLFIIYHFLHFTVGAVHPEHFSDIDPQGRKDVFNNFVISFQNPAITGAYLVAMTALCLHLAHAVTSMFKTLGVARGSFRKPIESIGPVIAIGLYVGFISVPLACQLGFIRTQYDVEESLSAPAAAHDKGSEAAHDAESKKSSRASRVRDSKSTSTRKGGPKVKNGSGPSGSNDGSSAAQPHDAE